MIKAFFVRILRAASTVGGAVVNAVTLNKTWVLYLDVDPADESKAYMLDRFEQHTWITAIKAKHMPQLGKSEVGVFKWCKVKGVNIDACNAHVENEEGGFKSRKFDSVKAEFTKAEFLAASMTATSKRGNRGRSI